MDKSCFLSLVQSCWLWPLCDHVPFFGTRLSSIVHQTQLSARNQETHGNASKLCTSALPSSIWICGWIPWCIEMRSTQKWSSTAVQFRSSTPWSLQWRLLIWSDCDQLESSPSSPFWSSLRLWSSLSSTSHLSVSPYPNASSEYLRFSSFFRFLPKWQACKIHHVQVLLRASRAGCSVQRLATSFCSSHFSVSPAAQLLSWPPCGTWWDYGKGHRTPPIGTIGCTQASKRLKAGKSSSSSKPASNASRMASSQSTD